MVLMELGVQDQGGFPLQDDLLARAEMMLFPKHMIHDVMTLYHSEEASLYSILEELLYISSIWGGRSIVSTAA